MGKLKTVLIMAGGTGGHIFPGLAVAKAMREKNIEVHWLGTAAGLESRLVPEAGFPLHTITISGVRGKGLKDLLFAPFRLTLAILQAMKTIQQIKPDGVIGMGGFASGPGGIAAWLLRKPLVIHEQNAKAGLTNTWLARLAKKVLTGFPNTFPESSKVITVGNPVRKEIANIPAPETRLQNSKNPLRLLVLGGSLGAQAINELVPAALAKLPEAERPVVIHQAGEKHLDTTRAHYVAARVNADIKAFITDMDRAYAEADIIICRAGALTIAELCAAGVGAVLIPFPQAVDDHQTANARFMSEAGAAILIQQKEVTADKLAALIKDFYVNREKCITMAKAAWKLRRVDAAEKVLMYCG